MDKQTGIDLIKGGGHDMNEPIIRIIRPELTEEERAKRMKRIEQAAARLLLAQARKEHINENRV